MSGQGLQGQRCWITGGGSGIGAAAARSLAAAGAEVVVSGRRREALERTAGEIERLGGRCQIAPLDVADAAACDAVMTAQGPFDIVVASAGLNVKQRRLEDIVAADWQQVIDVNLSGAFNVVRTALPGMRSKGGGLVVVISSWIGWRLEPVGGAAYAASKRALGALTEIINVEEGPNGIRATHLCPAEANTEVLDSRPVPPPPEVRAKMLAPDDIGRVIAFLANCPPSVCINELVLSPVTNRFYQPGAV